MRRSSLLSLLALPLLLSGRARGQATFEVIVVDPAGQGFNDTTAKTPVGGNSGTTLGQQRLIAFQYATSKWGEKLSSTIKIRVSASFKALECSPTSAVIGSAGPTHVFAGFPGAPLPDVWYYDAIGNKLAGEDLDPDYDIEAEFNDVLDKGTCGFPRKFYYGLDAAPTTGTTDFVTTLLHELGHGLGFLTVVNSSGRRLQDMDDCFMRLLSDVQANKGWAQMTDAERSVSTRNSGGLVWIGPEVTAGSGSVEQGKTNGLVQMYAPATYESGSSVSHFDKALFPNELMEPVYTGATQNTALTEKLLLDIGWSGKAAPGPATSFFLPSSARASGVGGAFYTTDLTVSNTGGAEASYTIKFLGNNVDGRDGAEKSFTLAAGKTATYRDVLGSVFGLSSGFGAIRISSSSSSMNILGQTSTPGGGGTFGQSVPAFAPSDLIAQGTARSITALREDGSFRTNLVLSNATELTLSVDATLVSEDGVTLGQRTYTLLPLAMTQISRIVRDMGVPGDVSSARLVLSTSTPSGAFSAYAAVIDNGTSDPRTLLPR